MSFQLLSLAAFLLLPASAQNPPPVHYSTVLTSPINPKISISYKSPPAGTCSTVFSSQKQYTGYISLPPFTLAPIQQNYSISTFFWFVEARESPQTSPLTIWLNGGPGSSSLIGLFTENGPCEVVQMQDGSYGTNARMWGWDRSSNMLYVDQPAQVGLSYDSLKQFTLDFLQDKYYPATSQSQTSSPSYAFLNGTFPSQNEQSTANTTQIAAHAVWHFLQGFLSAFPVYNPGVRPNSSTILPTGVNLFAESYGGVFGPVFADFFEKQNDMRQTGTLSPNKSLEIRLESLGIINGQIDAKVQIPFEANFAYNNTYGIQAIDKNAFSNAVTVMNSPGGCMDLLQQCRNLVAAQDPDGDGDVTAVNSVCASASQTCQRLENVYTASGRSVYDIRQKDPSPFPASAYIEYLNTAQVQQAIGTPINYTESSNAVFDAYQITGDFAKDTQLPALTRLLERGIRVALLYGDADYICNWQGGEAISLALSALVPAYAVNFPQSGYADIVVNSTYVGGAIRQYGNLSFSRIYDSGHLIPAYQPETAFTIFTRIIQGTAISTGESANLSSYATSGPQYSLKTNKAGSSRSPVCWVRSATTACTSDQRTSMLGGQGVVIQGVWYASQNDYKAPSNSVVAGKPGIPAPNMTSMSMSKGTPGLAATGVYVATGTPKPSFAVGNFQRCSLLALMAFLMSVFLFLM